MQSLHDITMHESQESTSPVQQTSHCLGQGQEQGQEQE